MPTQANFQPAFQALEEGILEQDGKKSLFLTQQGNVYITTAPPTEDVDAIRFDIPDNFDKEDVENLLTYFQDDFHTLVQNLFIRQLPPYTDLTFQGWKIHCRICLAIQDQENFKKLEEKERNKNEA